MKGSWDSIHVVEVKDQKSKARYKLTSTVMLSVETETNTTGQVNLAGSLTRQDDKEFPVSETNPHVANIGKMVEEMENKLRTTIELIYFGKTKDIVNTELRSAMGTSVLSKQRELQKQIGSTLGNKN
jgi:capping protein (actin filament) muscle Z-line, beta